MVEETLKHFPLADWEISFISRHCSGSTERAVRMAAEHLLRNAAMAGKDLTPIRRLLLGQGGRLIFSREKSSLKSLLDLGCKIPLPLLFL